MTTPLTNAWLVEQLALVGKATPGPWRCVVANQSVDFGRRIVGGGRALADLSTRDGDEDQLDAEFIAAAREGYPAALRALLDTRAALREVRRRKVTEYHTGTNPDSPRYWSCGLCSWTWKAGEAEVHEPSCPLANRTLLGEA